LVKNDLPPLPDILIHLEKRVNDPKADLESVNQAESILKG
jgi:HD-like signal output (HDOD) protein